MFILIYTALIVTFIAVMFNIKKSIEIKKLFQDLDRANAVLKHNERLKNFGEMASGVAHDLNNILFPIMGLSEVLVNEDNKLKSKSDIERIYKSINIAAKDGLNIVDRLKKTYMIKETKKKVTLINIDELLRDVIELSKCKVYTRSCETFSSIKISTVLDAKKQVNGVEHELREMFINLVFNAADAVNGNGLIKIKSKSNGNYISVIVEDNGIGMTEEVKRKCMNPFFTSKGTAGTGMGLSIAHEIVSSHNGKIELVSEQNNGCKFYVHLPVASEKILASKVCYS